MPAHPAITLHSHRAIDAAPIRIEDETYLLMQRARVTASSDSIQRFKDLSGNCFLRVDSDQRLQFSIDYFVLENNGLADYYPGRNLSDRAIAFATGTDQRHQFDTGGIFIYESATDDDPIGELRAGNVVISYDLHTGLDTTTYPATAGPALDPDYADVPAQAAPTEISNTAKNLLLQDLFYGESNLDAAFTVRPYNGDPAGAGTAIAAAATLTDPWTTTTEIGGDPNDQYAVPNDAIVFDSTGSSRTCTHIRLARGANVLCDVVLDSPLTVPANDTLRIPAASLKISLYYNPGGDNTTSFVDVETSVFCLQYCLGGTRAQYLPGDQLLYSIYNVDPGTDAEAVLVDQFAVMANSVQWTVTSRTVAAAIAAAGSNTAPAEGWSYTTVIAWAPNTRCRLLHAVAGSVQYIAPDAPYTSITDAALDIDA